MLTLDIAQSASTPRVFFDHSGNIMRISGESYPENSFEFYGPVIAWVRTHLAELDELKLDINVSYMNSSSTKCMLDLLDLLEDAHQKGARIAIVWRYDKDNPRSLDLAEEFHEEVTLPFSIVTCED